MEVCVECDGEYWTESEESPFMGFPLQGPGDLRETDKPTAGKMGSYRKKPK